MLWSLLDHVVMLLLCQSESNPTGIKSACSEFKRRNKNCQELKKNYQRIKLTNWIFVNFLRDWKVLEQVSTKWGAIFVR